MAETNLNVATHQFNLWREKNGTRVVAEEAQWKQPFKWQRQAEKDLRYFHERPYTPNPERPRVFCASLADVFEDWQGPMVNARGERVHGDQAEEWGGVSGPITMQDVRARLFRLIDATPNLDWMILTNRPENIMKFWPPLANSNMTVPLREILIRKNVWLGTSVENQEQADKRIPELLKVPAAVRFLSCEPLLGPIDFFHGEQDWGLLTGIKLCIVGGESGHGARPLNIEWIRSIVRQCKAASVPVFVKQIGARPYESVAGVMRK